MADTLTQRLSCYDPGVLPGDGSPGIPLTHVLDEGVALVHGAADDFAVLGKDDLDVGLLDDGCVEVADKDSGVEGTWVILVGHVASLTLTSHPLLLALLKCIHTHKCACKLRNNCNSKTF